MSGTSRVSHAQVGKLRSASGKPPKGRREEADIDLPLRCASSNLHRSPQPKPRRGGLFIDTETPFDSSFCFSAARTWSKPTNRNAGSDGSSGYDLALVAPPKNKKKKSMAWSLAINRPPLWGLGAYARSKTYPGLSKMWGMPSPQER